MDVVFDLVPTPAPRMSRRDKFKPSKMAQRYFKYANALRAMAGMKRYRITLPLSITFVAPMPKSWSGKKKERMVGTIKETRPDLDNYIKAFIDALASEDGWVAHYGEMKKIYGYEGQVIVHVMEDINETKC